MITAAGIAIAAAIVVALGLYVYGARGGGARGQWQLLLSAVAAAMVVISVSGVVVDVRREVALVALAWFVAAGVVAALVAIRAMGTAMGAATGAVMGVATNSFTDTSTRQRSTRVSVIAVVYAAALVVIAWLLYRWQPADLQHADGTMYVLHGPVLTVLAVVVCMGELALLSIWYGERLSGTVLSVGALVVALVLLFTANVLGAQYTVALAAITASLFAVVIPERDAASRSATALYGVATVLTYALLVSAYVTLVALAGPIPSVSGVSADMPTPVAFIGLLIGAALVFYATQGGAPRVAAAAAVPARLNQRLLRRLLLPIVALVTPLALTHYGAQSVTPWLVLGAAVAGAATALRPRSAQQCAYPDAHLNAHSDTHSAGWRASAITQLVLLSALAVAFWQSVALSPS